MISKTILHLGILCLSLASPFAQATALALKSHHIKWTGSMPAQAHYGLIAPLSVQLEISEPGEVQKLDVVLDMNSIDVTDLKPGKSRDQLIKHLRSNDFFAVQDHPTASFVLERHEGNALVGTLTIRGISKAASLPAKLEKTDADSWKLSGSFEFIRQDFNVRYQNKGFFSTAKEKLIRDEVKVEVALEFGPAHLK